MKAMVVLHSIIFSSTNSYDHDDVGLDYYQMFLVISERMVLMRRGWVTTILQSLVEAMHKKYLSYVIQYGNG